MLMRQAARLGSEKKPAGLCTPCQVKKMITSEFNNPSRGIKSKTELVENPRFMKRHVKRKAAGNKRNATAIQSDSHGHILKAKADKTRYSGPTDPAMKLVAEGKGRLPKSTLPATKSTIGKRKAWSDGRLLNGNKKTADKIKNKKKERRGRYPHALPFLCHFFSSSNDTLSGMVKWYSLDY